MGLTRVERATLFDYYGNLLADRQRDCFDLYYNEDYSLAEIAELKGISRHGVWDAIRHADERLMEFEEKTGLVRRIQELEWLLKTYQTN